MGVLEVKKKKEFSCLPDSLVEKALNLSKEDVKETRALLRKYFGVFLTNKVLKLKGEEVLKKHISSTHRDYNKFYETLLEGVTGLSSVVDLGCGVNGFSYGFLEKRFKDIKYLGVDALGQLIDKTNDFFKDKGYKNARALCIDLFDLEKIREVLVEKESPTAIFLFQTIDALEGFERNFSKKFILLLKESMLENDLLFISMPMKSISGKKVLESKRGWLKWFLEENFEVKEFFSETERFFRCTKK